MFEKEIVEFNLGTTKNDPQILIIGHDYYKNSVLVQNILHAFQNKPSIVINPQYKTDLEIHKVYKHFFPEKLMGTMYDKNVLNKLFKYNYNKIEKEKIYKNYKFGGNCLVLDNCLVNMKCDKLIELFMKGRHYKMISITSISYPKMIPPQIQHNIDYIFIGNNYLEYQHYICKKYCNFTFNELKILHKMNDFIVIPFCSSKKLVCTYNVNNKNAPIYNNELIDHFIK